MCVLILVNYTMCINWKFYLNEYRTVGSEYEMILMKQLDEKKISYLDEKQLRLLGYDKTPDFKLDIPIGTTFSSYQ